MVHGVAEIAAQADFAGPESQPGYRLQLSAGRIAADAATAKSTALTMTAAASPGVIAVDVSATALQAARQRLTGQTSGSPHPHPWVDNALPNC